MTHPFRTYSQVAAERHMNACTELAKLRVADGCDEMAGSYAFEAAHFGLMLLNPYTTRCHIAGSISSDDSVTLAPYAPQTA